MKKPVTVRTVWKPVTVPKVRSEKKEVIVRTVWSGNLRDELCLIQSTIETHRFAAMDMEFPGTLFRAPVEKHQYNTLSPEANYSFMKSNVDLLKPIQFGLALSDPYGNLPDFGTECSYVWEFNFNDFDPIHDPHNPDSIELLKRQGINFAENVEFGIESSEFRKLVFETGLIFVFSRLSWVTFQSSYDFGYLIKILTQKQLPEKVEGFMSLARCFFGVNLYDVKHVMKFCNGLRGGLEKVANDLGVVRVAGSSHQAGSDSLLTLQTFLKLTDSYFKGRREEIVLLGGVIHGLGSVRLVEDSISSVQSYDCPQVMT